MSPTAKARIRRRYDRWAPFLVGVAFIIGTAGVITGAFAMLANERQDRERDEGQSALLACFDTYAAATSTATRQVRVAQVAKDAADTVYQVALNAEGKEFLKFVRLLTSGKADGVEDIRPLERSLVARDVAGRALAGAQLELDRVREANPIPEPPSVVCKHETQDTAQ